MTESGRRAPRITRGRWFSRLVCLILLFVPIGLIMAAWVTVNTGQWHGGREFRWLTFGVGVAAAFGPPIVLLGLARAGRASVLVACAALASSLVFALVLPRSSGTSAGYAVLDISGGGSSPVLAAPLVAWRNSRVGFAMHPRYDGAAPVDSIRLTIPEGARSAMLSVTQPESSLIGADGLATAADGVELVVMAWTGGSRQQIGRRYLRPADTMENHWTDWTLDLPANATALDVAVTKGPGESTSYYDSTLVAISFFSPLVWLAERGQALLQILTVLLPLLAAAHLLSSQLASRRRTALAKPWGEFVPLLVAIGGLLLIINILVAYWTGHTRYIFIWDQFNYWSLTSDLATIFRDEGFVAGFRKVSESLSAEYNLIPALPPAWLGALLQQVDGRSYVFLIANLYFVPACIAVYGLVRTMADQARYPGSGKRSGSLFLLTICAVGLYPVFLRVLLWGQPDIGGVVLIVAGILLLDSALRAMAGGAQCARGADLFSTGILLASVFLLLILFRRWYLFIALSLVLIAAAAALPALVGAPDSPRGPLRRLFTLVAGVVTFVAVCTPGFLLARISILAHYNYAGAYAAYARDWLSEFSFFPRSLGILPLIVTSAMLAVSLATPGSPRLKWLSFASAPMAVVLFWIVQRGFTYHHFYLLFVGLTVSTTYGLWILARRSAWPVAESFALAGSLLTLTWSFSGGHIAGEDWFSRIDLRPPRRSDIEELVRLGHFLGDAVSRGRQHPCVIGSNYTFSRETIANLWQVDDSAILRTLDRHLLVLPQVDTRDGAPTNFEMCELALVSEPVTLHLKSDMQRCVSLPAQDLLAHTGLGVSFHRRPESFTLQNGVTVRVFERIRATTGEEWTEFLQRFNAPH